MAAKPCRVKLPAAWASKLNQGRVNPDRGEQLVLQLGLDDGYFTVSTVKGRRHTLEWRQGRQRRVVQDFGLDHPEWQVLGATWDGRYLAYRVDQSYSSLQDFSLYVWDSQAKRKPVRVAHGEPDADGTLMPTPLVDPVLADGWLYWTQTRDRDPEHTVLSGYQLSDARTKRLSKGFGRGPVRFGRTLVWADSAKAGQATALRFLDLDTHRPAPAPAPLADVTGPYYLGGNQETLTWVAGRGGRQLWAWRANWPAPRLLLDRGDAPQFPEVASDVIVFGQQDAMYVADPRSSSYAKLTPRYGGVSADGGPVVTVAFAPKGGTAVSEQSLLDTTGLPPLGRVGC